MNRHESEALDRHITGDYGEDSVAAEYRWKIDKDYLTKEGEESYAVGIEGPYNLDDSLTANPQGFTLYDDDDIAYYHGWLYGEYMGFEPVDDFGLPYAGAVHIRFDGDEHYL